MALFLASMCAAFQLASTYLTASNFGEPAWLVLQSVFTTQTWFGGQERALRAVLVVLMTAVGNLRMATILGPSALGTAWRRFGAAWQWRVDNSPAAIAANLIEYGLPTCPTGTFVAEFLASMVGITTLQRPTTAAGTDMFCFNVFAGLAWSIQRSRFSAISLTLGRLSFSWAATFSAFVASAVEGYSADSHALRSLL